MVAAFAVGICGVAMTSGTVQKTNHHHMRDMKSILRKWQGRQHLLGIDLQWLPRPYCKPMSSFLRIQCQSYYLMPILLIQVCCTASILPTECPYWRGQQDIPLQSCYFWFWLLFCSHYPGIYLCNLHMVSLVSLRYILLYQEEIHTLLLFYASGNYGID